MRERKYELILGDDDVMTLTLALLQQRESFRQHKWKTPKMQEANQRLVSRYTVLINKIDRESRRLNSK